MSANPIAIERKRIRNLGIDRLEKAVGDQPPPPCATCIAAERCGKYKLACLDFAEYLNASATARVRWTRERMLQRRPTRAIYEHLTLCTCIVCRKKVSPEQATADRWGTRRLARRRNGKSELGNACELHKDVP